MPKFKIGDRVYISHGDTLGPTIREVKSIVPPSGEIKSYWYELKDEYPKTLISGAREDRLVSVDDKTKWEVAARLRK